MNGVTVIGLFCDDIREESQGTHTIVGVYPDNLNVPTVPGMLPKLGFYSRIRVPDSIDIKSASLRFLFPGQPDLNIMTVESHLIEAAKQQATGASLFGTIVTKAVVSPMPIMDFGRLTAVMNVDGQDIVCALLNFQAAPTATPLATQPSNAPLPRAKRSRAVPKKKAKKP